jgi:hypothetical protein
MNVKSLQFLTYYFENNLLAILKMLKLKKIKCNQPKFKKTCHIHFFFLLSYCFFEYLREFIG